MKELQKISKNYTPELYKVIKTVDKQTNQPNLFLVMECFDVDLKQFIKNAKQTTFTGQHIKLITYNFLCALKFIHKANIIHRDIKPSNIFINKNCDVKIGDFGISRS